MYIQFSHNKIKFVLQTDPSLPVLAPGDKEKMAENQANISGTMSYVSQQIESSAALAKRLKVKPMELIGENQLTTINVLVIPPFTLWNLYFFL